MDPNNSLEQEQISTDVDLKLIHLRTDSLIHPRSDQVNQSYFNEPSEDVSEYLPKAPGHNYTIKPSLEELSKKTLRELRSMPCFEVSNEHGKIKFQAITKEQGIDITNVDLAKDVKILPKAVEVYDNDDGSIGGTALGSRNKPDYGRKLNVPSIITLYKVAPTKNRSAADQEKILKNLLERQQEDMGTSKVEHLNYDYETFTWEFKVPHF